LGAKKTKRPARSIRYLLYADQKFRRLSLRRISAQLKRAKRSRPSARPKNAAPPTRSTPFPWTRVAAGLSMCVVAATVLFAARNPEPDVETTRRAANEIARSDVAQAVAAPLLKPMSRPKAAEKTPAPAPVSKPSFVTEPASVSKPLFTAKPTVALPAEATPAPPAGVTLTGCLERNDNAYWLKDVSGADVQAGRSWKSGFLKKRSPRVEVVDASKTLKLPNHVGERVAATGVLAKGEMQARSIRRLSASCS